MFWEDFRELVPATKNYIYLNHAALSPTPLPVLYETFRYLYEVSKSGTIADNEEQKDELFHIRKNISNLIKADPLEISLIPNTSFGINEVAHGLEYDDKSNVVTDSLEFPATVYPFLKIKKLEKRIVNASPYDIEDKIIENIDENTKIVSISHVSFNSGVRIDVQKIVTKAKKVGALVLLDIIQSAGAIKINVKDLGIDFAVAGGYKWLMSPQGSGFMYIRKGLLEDPPFYGWKSAKNYLDFDPTKFELEKGPRRIEIGTIDIAANLGLSKSAEIISSHEDEIEKRVLQLSAYAIDLAEDKKFEVITPKEKRAGIVVIKVKKPKEIASRLAQRNIIVSPRGEGIRISTHFYNTEEEIEKTINSISQEVS
ncbi:aminotransferase class V-fold PLP-dependent enzyme [Acidianus ambivalens]|uniref:Aminotransferase class V-fold PLP-dependent enzyme n=1 Tax=Acidianus ambivalens TaxID=2283 RepID=A0A650CV21_ACIAM|nr:aminotransferase class V-fold PLP-dependent enzyme [Acidianus ambivalens]MQL55702.1 aminotransferase class V-fold PLP-dependent enzyme [Acidianus ambivalens]QGR21721.1 aminotransferase class V-fold PLP-dependent enzyme [Acidianus ambivalens]